MVLHTWERLTSKLTVTMQTSHQHLKRCSAALVLVWLLSFYSNCKQYSIELFRSELELWVYGFVWVPNTLFLHVKRDFKHKYSIWIKAIGSCRTRKQNGGEAFRSTTQSLKKENLPLQRWEIRFAYILPFPDPTPPVGLC